MASVNFKRIIEKKLGANIAGSSQEAIIQAAGNIKGLDMSGSLTLKAKDDLSEEDIQKFLDASDDYVDVLINESVLNYDVFSTSRKTKNINETAKIEVDSVYGLKLKGSNKNISALNLVRLLNTVLYKYVQGLMGIGGRLKNQTGRLAHSATITSMDFSSKEAISKRTASVYFTYLLMPYQVFESGDRSNSGQRSPTALIDLAIGTALKQLLDRDSYKLTRFYKKGPFNGVGGS